VTTGEHERISWIRSGVERCARAKVATEILHRLAMIVTARAASGFEFFTHHEVCYVKYR
jgi:hypothetical protein